MKNFVTIFSHAVPIVQFHSEDETETRAYQIEKYKEHIIDYAQKELSHEIDLNEWKIADIRKGLIGIGELTNFEKLFTTQTDGLTYFSGKSKLESCEIIGISPIQTNYYQNGQPYDYARRSLVFENGVTGEIFINLSRKGKLPIVGVEYEFIMRYENASWSKSEDWFNVKPTIEMKDAPKAIKKKEVVV